MSVHIHAAEERREAADAPFDWPINQTTRWYPYSYGIFHGSVPN